MKKKDVVKKATLAMLEKRDKNKGKIKLPKFDNPEKYFNAIEISEQEALAKMANKRF